MMNITAELRNSWFLFPRYRVVDGDTDVRRSVGRYVCYLLIDGWTVVYVMLCSFIYLSIASSIGSFYLGRYLWLHVIGGAWSINNLHIPRYK